MLGLLRRQSRNWLFGGLHLVLLVVAAKAESRVGWVVALTAMAALSFFAWVANYRRLRHIADTPTSHVATAAQGYVELAGRVEAAEVPLVAPYSGLRCCWYRYQVEHKGSDGKWSYQEGDESDAPFVLVDETGRCTIEPAGAEIHCESRDVMTRDDYRYTEWRLMPGDRLYAIGAFVTRSAVPTPRDIAQEVSFLLGEWKADKPSLLARFDLDRDGAIDLEEWELARRAARREVDKRLAAAAATATAGNHTLCRPEDGRPFLISNRPPERLVRMFGGWSAFHILVFLAAGAAALALGGLR